MPVIVKERFGAGCEIDRAKHEPDGARIDPLKVDRLVDQFAQRRGRHRWHGPISEPTGRADRKHSGRA